MSQRPQLERDPSCLQDLSWRIRGAVSIDVLKLKLQQRGWRNGSPSDNLLIFRSPEGDEFVLVPRTGRIQLRVSYQVQPGERAAYADQLFRELFTSLPAQT